MPARPTKAERDKIAAAYAETANAAKTDFEAIAGILSTKASSGWA